jgi:hypothetical protein
VQLYGQLAGASSWGVLQTATTAGDGTVRFTHVPAGPTSYKLRVVPDFDHTVGNSSVVSVSVSRSITLGATPQTVVHGGSFTLSGAVRPNAAGIHVYVQRWTGSAYATVATVVAKPGGVFGYVVKTTTAGSYGYRVFVYADAKYGAYTTGRVTVVAT